MTEFTFAMPDADTHSAAAAGFDYRPSPVALVLFNFSACASITGVMLFGGNGIGSALLAGWLGAAVLTVLGAIALSLVIDRIASAMENTEFAATPVTPSFDQDVDHARKVEAASDAVLAAWNEDRRRDALLAVWEADREAEAIEAAEIVRLRGRNVG